MAKHLIIGASDLVAELVRGAGEGPPERAALLVERSALPGCYLDRYDESFLTWFHNVIEATRNSLVSDLPFLGSTAAELAGRAILAELDRILAAPGETLLRLDGPEAQAVEADRDQLADELDRLRGSVIEDDDVLALFDVAPGAGPPAHVESDRASLIRFENWLIPFGNPPRPAIDADGRAWAA